MPITRQELADANAAMLGNTNRGILFTTVNLAKDAPRLSAYLSDYVAGIYTWEEFRNRVQQKLVVKTFAEFLDKFQPCFFYRLAPAREPVNVDLGGGDSQEGESEEAEEAVEAGAEEDVVGSVDLSEEPASEAEAQEEFALASSLPEYEFSLEGGPAELGWKRVPITLDHPLFKNLAMHLKDKALTSKTTVDVNVDDALWGFKPQNQESQLRKSAQDFKSSSKKLALEMKRDPKSPDTRKALETYDRRLSDLEAAIGDDLRVLPVIASGLATARKALGSGPGGAGPAMGAFMLEIGEGARLITKPALPADTLKALPEAAAQNALESGSKEIVLLSKALESHPLAERKVAEIVKMPDNEQYPALVGSLMQDMVRRHKINPAMGNMLAVILQDPQQLATWNLMPKEVEVFHDTFLGVYSYAVENFLRAVVPMFETLMGVYALFNEFPYDVRGGQPELIITNDELTDLWRIYNEEISTFLRHACLQAANAYRDAISFAIVPTVAPFKNKAPAGPPAVFIRAGEFVKDFNAPPPVEEAKDVSALRAEFDSLRQQEAGESGGFGRVAGAPEVMGLMVLGHECSFNVFFSPERMVIAGRTDQGDLETMQEGYCPDTVVDKEWAVSGVLCLPDFVCLPPDGMLFTGKVMDGRSVGVEVPQIVIRSCYVAAGRYMANDNPEVLKSLVNKLPLTQRQTMKVRPTLPGLSVDLGVYPILGKTNLAPDHFLMDHIMRTLQGRDKSFLVFSHVHGQSPNIAFPRTLGRARTKDTGEQRYIQIHHWRQQRYLQRLLFAAYWKGYAGVWPGAEEMAALMNQITNWMGWYDMQREGYVNSFPSELIGDAINVEPITEGGQVVSYILDLPLKAAVLGPLELTIE